MSNKLDLKNQIQLQDTYNIDTNKMLRFTIRK